MTRRTALIEGFIQAGSPPDVAEQTVDNAHAVASTLLRHIAVTLDGYDGVQAYGTMSLVLQLLQEGLGHMTRDLHEFLLADKDTTAVVEVTV